MSFTKPARVCVTGANGFIALHLVKALLSKGYHVVAAVRGTKSSPKLTPLLNLKLETPGRLDVVENCDLLNHGSFDSAIAGCSTVFHTASPFWMDDRITDPRSQLIKPAEEGTLNVLKSCESSKSVNRVVLTSSFASIMNVGGWNPWPDDFHYSEDHWNISSAPNETGTFPDPVNAHAYRWSKTVAEKAAWEFRSSKFNVTTINPPMVLGRNMQVISSVGDLNQSSLILYRLLSGDMKHVMPGSVGFVDVEDVAKAHIAASECEEAAGQRYICSAETQTWLQVAEILRDLFPMLASNIPKYCADGSAEQPCMLLKNNKIKDELGIKFKSLRETLFDQGSALQDAGLLN